MYVQGVYCVHVNDSMCNVSVIQVVSELCVVFMQCVCSVCILFLCECVVCMYCVYFVRV